MCYPDVFRLHSNPSSTPVSCNIPPLAPSFPLRPSPFSSAYTVAIVHRFADGLTDGPMFGVVSAAMRGAQPPRTKACLSFVFTYRLLLRPRGDHGGLG